MVKSITQWIKYNKEGIMIGAMIGLVYSIYLAMNGTDLDMIMSLHKTGIVDQVIGSAQNVKDVALTKVGLMFIIIGGLLGGLIDHAIYPNK